MKENESIKKNSKQKFNDLFLDKFEYNNKFIKPTNYYLNDFMKKKINKYIKKNSKHTI